MPKIELTIPAGKIDRIVHALCKAGGFEDETPKNAKQAIIDHIKRIVWRVETQEAEQAASETVTVDDKLAT